MARRGVFKIQKIQHSKDVNYPKLTYQFNASPIKIPRLVIDTDKIILKFILKDKIVKIAKTILKRKIK